MEFNLIITERSRQAVNRADNRNCVQLMIFHYIHSDERGAGTQFTLNSIVMIK